MLSISSLNFYSGGGQNFEDSKLVIVCRNVILMIVLCFRLTAVPVGLLNFW